MYEHSDTRNHINRHLPPPEQGFTPELCTTGDQSHRSRETTSNNPMRLSETPRQSLRREENHSNPLKLPQSNFHRLHRSSPENNRLSTETNDQRNPQRFQQHTPSSHELSSTKPNRSPYLKAVSYSEPLITPFYCNVFTELFSPRQRRFVDNNTIYIFPLPQFNNYESTPHRKKQKLLKRPPFLYYSEDILRRFDHLHHLQAQS